MSRAPQDSKIKYGGRYLGTLHAGGAPSKETGYEVGAVNYTKN